VGKVTTRGQRASYLSRFSHLRRFAVRRNPGRTGGDNTGVTGLRRRDFLTSALLAAPLVSAAPSDEPTLGEDRFRITPARTIGIRAIHTTPAEFLRNNPKVDAAINGPYFARAGNHTLGVAHFNGQELGSGGLQDVRGYFTVNQSGRVVAIGEALPDKLS